MTGIDKTINALKKLGGVKAIILFGSYARGRQRKDSDIDLCVISDDDEALEHSSDKIDISIFSRLPLAVRFRVFRDGKVLWCRDDVLLHRLKFWTIKQYLDEAHWRNRLTDVVLS